MAASIYATPPPDLSSEDTALSDVSNTSSTTPNINNPKIAVAVTAPSSIGVSSTSSSSSSLSSTASSLNRQNNHPHLDSSSKPTTTTTPAMTNTCEAKSSTTPKLSTNKSKRTIADVFKDKTAIAHHNSSSSFAFGESSINATTTSINNNTDDDTAAERQSNNNAAMAAVAAAANAANAAMQLQLLEALNDAAKKRRKQHNPTRMDDDKSSGDADDDGGSAGGELNDHHGVRAIKREQVSPGGGGGICNSNNSVVDYEDKLSKMFLPKSMEHLKETFELLQQQQQKQMENISKAQKSTDDMMQQRSDFHEMVEQQQLLYRQAEAEAFNNNPYQTFCKECGENFENEFKLSLHMMQEHNESQGGVDQTTGEMSPLDILASVKVKLERPECESPSSGQNSNQGNASDAQNMHIAANGKEHQAWMGQPQMPPMGFPFPPEAAAALQAGGYLPLLAVPGFPGVDGLNRPPLRIFNPEAFCELCNKEFCNKYFLKTHKANKHGIYDPVGDAAGSASQPNNTMNAMNQMFQLQMQQQQQHLQQQHQMKMELAQQQQQQQLQQQAPPPKMLNESTRKDREEKSSNSQQQPAQAQQGPAPVFCDICSKRFTNVFAMRRHRSKAHEPNAANASNSQRNSPNAAQSTTTDSNISAELTGSKAFQMPDGFRQDFALEQEEVSFTPQPRKLSAQSQQQARDANFAHDKLKRLGVINPEAFCELCGKEYCNKYFLRTHKWKRHGIFMPPEDNENTQMLPNWPFMNMPGMPVNLMMAQRMMAGADISNDELDQQQSSKRIKLEAPELLAEDVLVKEPNNDENQENRSENNQHPSIPSTPEPHKIHPDGQAVIPSAEAAMGLQNLQKLQSMIQQLNDLNGKRPLPCHLCGRELENQYALQAHIMTEHGGGMEGMPHMSFPTQLMLQQQALLKQSPNGSPGSLMPVMAGMGGLAGELRCTPCDREFSNLPEFQKHITEVHLLPNTKGSPLREGFVTPERPVNSAMGQATRVPYTITPTSSYCEICNKELCNKYFMKTHMQRMHGIEIENGAQIGGVVCNICNKELCSKYFLRVHKHNTHGIIEEGSPLPQPRQNGLSAEQAAPPPISIVEPENLNRSLNMSPFGSGGSDGKAESISYSSYSESCPICAKRFRSPKWLRSHLLNDHGPTGVEKMRELEQQYGSLSKPSSPTLKIPNGTSSSGSTSNNATPHNNVPSPAQLAQALQNLNAQQLLQNMPKNQMPASPFNNDQNIPSPRLKEYQCSLCSFTTPYYAFLFIHERTHSIMNSGEQGAEQGMENKNKVIELNEDDQLPETETMEVDKENTLNSAETADLTHDLHKDDSEPTNLSMRTPSPKISNTKEELAKASSASPILLPNSVGNDKSYASFDETPKRRRSIASSPIFNMQHQLLQEMADQFGKTATYAVPREAKSESSAPQMQAFVLEAEQMDECNRFVPAIIYLPVKERITGSTKLSFNLTPV